jgi:hypothetical protein
MAVAKRVFESANGTLAAALAAAGIPAGQLLGGIFNAEVGNILQPVKALSVPRFYVMLVSAGSQCGSWTGW